MRSRIFKLVFLLAAVAGILKASMRLIDGAKGATPLTSMVTFRGQPLPSVLTEIAFAHDKLLALSTSPQGDWLFEVDFSTQSVTLSLASPDEALVAAFWKPGEQLVVATATRVFVTEASDGIARAIAPFDDQELEIISVAKTPYGLEALVVQPESDSDGRVTPRDKWIPALADVRVARWSKHAWEVRPFVGDATVSAVAAVCHVEMGPAITIADGHCVLAHDDLRTILLSSTTAHAHHDGVEWLVDLPHRDRQEVESPQLFASRFFETPGKIAQHPEIVTTSAETALHWPWLAGGIDRGVQVQLMLAQLGSFAPEGVESGYFVAAVSFGATRVAKRHPNAARSPARLYAADARNWDWLWDSPSLARRDATTGTLLDQPTARWRLTRFVLKGELPIPYARGASLLGRALLRMTPVVVFLLPPILPLLLAALEFVRRRNHRRSKTGFTIPLWFLSSLAFIALWGLAFARDVVIRL